ncbi:hypothetical protein ABMX80_23040, partial [Vibrio vulnificus]|uniref:hypothetical protein n=1 Tax=Vibrio vulnificus TaxID=672 RepID=UPI00405A221C
GNHLSAHARCRVENALTATDNKRNDNTVAIPTHYTRSTMGPRVREDDEIRDGNKKPSEDQRQRTKNLNTAAAPPAVIPVHTGNHLPAHAGCRVENTLATTDNKSNDNTVAIPTHYTRSTMGPRVREDDKIRDGKRLIDRSYKEEVGITKMRQDKPTAPLSHKHSAHRHHTTSRHSRAHGNPFIRTRRMSRLETHSPQPTTTWSETDNNTGNKAVIPSNNTRCTMGPRVREDDEIRDGNKKPSEDQRQRTKNLNTAATPPAVIPVHTGNHLSTRAGCRV